MFFCGRKQKQKSGAIFKVRVNHNNKLMNSCVDRFIIHKTLTQRPRLPSGQWTKPTKSFELNKVFNEAKDKYKNYPINGELLILNNKEICEKWRCSSVSDPIKSGKSLWDWDTNNNLNGWWTNWLWRTIIRRLFGIHVSCENNSGWVCSVKSEHKIWQWLGQPVKQTLDLKILNMNRTQTILQHNYTNQSSSINRGYSRGRYNNTRGPRGRCRGEYKYIPREYTRDYTPREFTLPSSSSPQGDEQFASVSCVTVKTISQQGM